MQENIITGLFFAAGALAYNIWGFINALKAAEQTPQKEKFNWVKCAVTILPSLVGGFLAGFNLSAASATDYITMIMSGFGLAAAQGQLGINSFFDPAPTP
jgi:hypothetical protein